MTRESDPARMLVLAVILSALFYGLLAWAVTR
jgi:hypothetical protein